jgi:Zn-dependent metalloprotease
MRKFFAGMLAALLVVGVTFLGGTASANNSQNRSDRAERRARNHLAGRGVDVGRLRARLVDHDDLGMSHVRFSQTAGGVRVFGHELITHEKADGKFIETSGELFGGPVNSTTPALGAADAVQLAKAEFGQEAGAVAELVIYPQGGAGVLSYLVDIKNTDVNTSEPRREMIVIDALTGAVVDRWNNLQTSATTGTGHGFYAGQVTGLPIDLTSGTHYLFDVPNNGKTFDYKNRTCSIMGCTKTGDIYTSADNIFGATGSLSDRQSIGVDAHFFAERTLSYFKSTFGRNGIDNNGNTNLRFGFMVSRTHYGNNYNNAFWDGASMTYGDGDGSTYRPFDAVDVVGHEMMHGITERTSDLTYSNESGAANESFSDIFGLVVEFHTGTRTGFGGVSYPADFWIGEDLYYSNDPANPTRGIRNMEDPHKEGDPCHYTERYTGTSDNGGVHINSGIMNKVFMLLAFAVTNGRNHKDVELNGANATTVNAIGLADAAKIAYDADTKYCTASDTYARVANAWMNAAKARYGAGTVQAQQTFNAWKASGVTPTVTP